MLFHTVRLLQRNLEILLNSTVFTLLVSLCPVYFLSLAVVLNISKWYAFSLTNFRVYYLVKMT
jgi:hypothetical protein